MRSGSVSGSEKTTAPGGAARAEAIDAAASRHRRLGVAALLLGLAAATIVRADDALLLDNERPWRVPRAQSEVNVDGVLDEPAWEGALAVSLRYETRPGENVAAPVETRARVIYDERNVYFAFQATDPDPERIRAHLADRDTTWSDDWVGVVLDTFNDERRAFEFFVNPLGVQMDLLNDDVVRSEDSAWDALWTSAGRIGEDGYVVELAIPFSSLRFPAGPGAKVWGVDLIRNYPRSDRVQIRSQPHDRDRNCYLCQLSKMRGFESVSPGRNIELAPTLVAGRTDVRDEGATALSRGDLESELGFTGKWGVTPNMTLMGTLNPDFSQVEADVAQLDVNNQFALFFPEKRPFFLEGADFFDTPFDAVFTRNVADPDWGLKLTGKAGANAIGVFAAEDAVTQLTFPGSQSSRADSFQLATTDAVVRYRRDVGKGSALGALVTSREGTGYSNLVAGVDGSLRFRESNSVSFQYLSSQSEYPLEVGQEYEQPLGSFDDAAWRVGFQHDSRNWFVYARYEDVGTDFRADMGFMPRVDYDFTLGGLQHTWWGDEESWWKSFWLGGDWDLTRDQSGQLLEREAEVWTQVNGPLQSWLWLDVADRTRFFDGVTFEETVFNTWFEIQPTGDFFFGMATRWGDDIDFDNTRPGEVLVLEPQLRYNVGSRARLDLSHQLRRLDVEGGRLFEAGLTELRAVYQFNIRTFVRLITQYTDISRDPALYEEEVEASTRSLFSQLLLSYKLNPRTVAFLGYAETRAGENGSKLVQDDRSVFVKIGYSWVL